MKIVKKYKSNISTAETFGVWPGKTIAVICSSDISHGGINDRIEYVKVGNAHHEAFLWFDDLDDARAIGETLLEFANEAERRDREGGRNGR